MCMIFMINIDLFIHLKKINASINVYVFSYVSGTIHIDTQPSAIWVFTSRQGASGSHFDKVGIELSVQ